MRENSRQPVFHKEVKLKARLRNKEVLYSASKNWSSVLNILIVLAIPQEPERIRTCN